MKDMKELLFNEGVDKSIISFILLASTETEKDLSFESRINIESNEKITYLSSKALAKGFDISNFNLIRVNNKYYKSFNNQKYVKDINIIEADKGRLNQLIINIYDVTNINTLKDYETFYNFIINSDTITFETEEYIDMLDLVNLEPTIIRYFKKEIKNIFSKEKEAVEKLVDRENLDFHFISEPVLLADKNEIIEEIDTNNLFEKTIGEESRNLIGESNGMTSGIPLETLRKTQEIGKEVVNSWKSGTLLDGNKVETVTINEPKIESSSNSNMINPYSAIMQSAESTTPLNDGITFEKSAEKIIEELDIAAENANNKTPEEINMLQKYYKALPVGFYNIINNTTDIVFISDAFSNIKDLNPSEEDKANVLNFAIYKFKDEKFIQEEYEKVFYDNTKNTLKAEMNKVINKEEPKNDILSMMGLNNKEVKIVPASTTTPVDSNSLINQVEEIKISKENTEVKPKKYGLLNVTTESQYGIDQIVAKKSLFHDPVNDPEEIAFTNLLQIQNDQINARVNAIRNFLTENGLELTLTPELNLISNQPGIFGTPVEKLKTSYQVAGNKFLQDIKAENIAYEVAEKLSYAERMIKLINLEKNNAMSVNSTSPLTNIAGLNFNKN